MEVMEKINQVDPESVYRRIGRLSFIGAYEDVASLLAENG